MTPRDDDDLPMSKIPPVPEDVRRELEFHLEERAAELMARGLSAEAARRAAREAFGDRDVVERECRTIEQRRRATKRRARRMEEVRADLVHGTRLLLKSPGFTLAAVLTLALGIGATAAIFSIVDQVLLRPLPFHESDQLVRVDERHDKGWGNLPWANFVDLERDNKSFVAMASYGSNVGTVLGAGAPLRVRVAAISRDFFKVMDVRPFLGRIPRADEHQLGAPAVAVVSYGFWRDRLGAPKTLEGFRVKMREDHQVVGVMPPGFTYPDEAEIWYPLELVPQTLSRTSHNWDVIARLRSGVTAASADREGSELVRRMAAAFAPDFDGTGLIVVPLQDALTANSRTPLYLLLGASLFVLLAACTNLASAMLARGAARETEVAMRTALGATRGRIVRQLLTECALLSALGLVAGLALAWTLLHLYGGLAPETLRQWRVHLDGRVLSFGAFAALCTTIFFGLVPSLRLSSVTATNALRGGARAGTNPTRVLLWRSLVAIEVAFAAALLAGSALLLRSFSNVLESRLGFEPAGATIATVNLPSINYGDTAARVADFHTRVLARLAQEPEVKAAGFANIVPLKGDNISGTMDVEGRPLGANGKPTGYALYRVVGGDYFTAAGIRLERGRTFNSGDDRDAPRVVVVSAELARRQWPGLDPIGRRVRPAGQDGLDEPWWTVVGVVDDIRSGSQTAPPRETYYFDDRQRPAYRSRSVTYVVRSAGGDATLDAPIRRSIAAVDPEVPVEVSPMTSLVRGALSDRVFVLVILGAFAAVALLLAIVGVYAVVSYSVEQRTREIGVRIALGASPAEVWRLVIGGAAGAVAPGLAIGALLAVVDARALRALVYGVTPFDPLSLVAAFVVLALAAFVAAVGPAARAMRVSPIGAIRSN